MEGKHIHRKNIYSGSTVAKHICFAMAQHAEQENMGAATQMEDEEDEEEHHRHRGDRPLLPLYAQEQQDAKPLPLPVKSRSMRSRVEQGKEEASGSGVRSLSFSKLFSFRIAASSATMDIDQLAAAACGGEDASAELPKRQQPNPVCRSQSMPMTSIRRLPHGHKKRVADSSSLPRFRVSSMPVAAPEPSEEQEEEQAVKEAEEDEEEVGEEEAVCRICMVALGEGGNVLKLECHCKGELALAHRDCALKWFSIKGNTNCDVCSHDVLNLPVTLRRVRDNPPLLPPSPATPGPDNGNGGGNGFRGWWWHRTAILVVVSMLAYFCFLEQLLVGDHGAAAALAVSLPFACVLGLFSALTTARMVSSRRYVWVYSAAQFLFVVLFTHLFYRYVRLQAVIAIILSTFAGFGVAICANAVLLQIIRWRARNPLPLSSESHLQTAQP